MTRRVYVSTGWSLPLGLAANLPEDCLVEARGIDYGLRGWKARTFLLRQGARVAWRARRFESLVICNCGIEAVIGGFVSMVVAPRQGRVLVDFLVPTSERIDNVLRWALRPWKSFGCIRSNDRAVLKRRFGVGDDRSAFIAFPCWSDGGTAPPDVGEDGTIYAGGAAHRDWRTFMAAMSAVCAPVVCAIGIGPVPEIDDGLRARLTLFTPDNFLSPDEGRRFLAAATVVVMPMTPTDLPSGPLVFLDAMSLGKAVVTTACPGAADYARDDVNCLVVPPGDPQAMAAAVTKLLKDDELRSRLCAGARDTASEHTSSRFSTELLSLAAPDRTR